MYDYLAKIILLGPSGAGKSVLSSVPLLHPYDKLTPPLRSCVLHRFVQNECKPSLYSISPAPQTYTLQGASSPPRPSASNSPQKSSKSAQAPAGNA